MSVVHRSRRGGWCFNALLLSLLLCLVAAVYVTVTDLSPGDTDRSGRGSGGSSRRKGDGLSARDAASLSTQPESLRKGNHGQQAGMRSHLDDRSSEAPMDILAYNSFIMRDLFSISASRVRTTQRWEVLQSFLAEDRLGPQVLDPFLIVEYGSGFGSLSVSLAAAFQTAVVFSVDNGAVDEHTHARLPYEAKVLGKTGYHTQLIESLGLTRNAVCKADITAASLAALRMARLSVDYQLLLGFAQHLPVESEARLGSLLDTLIHLARVTIIEVPAAAEARDTAWYAHGSPLETVEHLLAKNKFIHARMLTTEPLQIMAIENTYEEEGLSLRVGRRMCERLFRLLLCSNTLLPEWCPNIPFVDLSLIAADKASNMAGPGTNAEGHQHSHRHGQKQQQKQQGGEKDAQSAGASESRGAEKSKQRAGDVRHGSESDGAAHKISDSEPQRIPRSVCGEGKGRVVEKVRGCGSRRPKEEWEWENDGWYKCRNATHWLTGCRRMKPSSALSG